MTGEIEITLFIKNLAHKYLNQFEIRSLQMNLKDNLVLSSIKQIKITEMRLLKKLRLIMSN